MFTSEPSTTRSRAILLALFLVSSGVAASASAGFGSLALAQPQAPLGAEFISLTMGEKGQPLGSGPLGQTQWLPAPAQGLTGSDYLFVRIGDTYTVVSLNADENSGPAVFMQSSSLPQVWVDQARRRSRFRICVEILEVLKGGPMTPFEIAFQLRLNSKRTRAYIEQLKEKELVERSLHEDTFVYGLTPRGWAFSQSMREAFVLDL